jgi:replicative DNA helicase
VTDEAETTAQADEPADDTATAVTPIPNEPTDPTPDHAAPPSVAPFDPTRRRGTRTQQQAGAPAPPPHNLTAEESLLGAMLLSRDAISVAAELASADDFYKPAHAHIFEAVTTLDNAGDPADVVTVADWLTRHELIDAIGGPATLINLQAGTPAIGNAAHYARIVVEHATLRRLIGAAGEIAELAKSQPDDVAAAVDQAEQLLFRITDPRRAVTGIGLRDALGEVRDRLADRIATGGGTRGSPSGFYDLDRLIYGHEPGQLTIVGARPSMGKSSFAGALAANAAHEGHPVLVFSAEMTHEELTERFMAAESGVDLDRLKLGTVVEKDWPAIGAAVTRLSDTPIEIVDASTVTLMTIRSLARRATRRWGRTPLIIVDYLQLMTPLHRSENRNLEVSELSRGLTRLAGDLDAPVIALSQLTRNLEQRRDKRPILSDLRDSGAVEQDADKVLLLYRDEVYDPTSPDKGIMEVHVAKHRNGPTGVARLAYMPHRSQFRNMVRANG